ncbi:hypothetical protein, partial [Shewanella frigidimarina]|uniref:hypothetical protein n=1 Tax=Shewanella frigidimarina TaxID=56812 RepID=UPI003F9EE404
MATFSLFENVAGRLGVLRGNSRWFPLSLVWAKRHDVSGRRPCLMWSSKTVHKQGAFLCCHFGSRWRH